MKIRLIKMLATFFYVGQMPWVPGTWGSLAGALLYLALGAQTTWTHILVFILVCAAGFFAAGPSELIFGRRDPRPVVIDEVAGIFLVYIGFKPTLALFLTGFFVFRFFDIIKPPPARRLERIPGSPGIMLDDLLCGCYAHLVLRILVLIHWL